MKLKPCLLSILICLLFSAGVVSQIKFEKFVRNPDSLVAYQLHEKRAVMLADMMHSASLSLITPVKVLHQWMKSNIELKKTNTSLTLALEYSEADAIAIEDFFRTGNYDTLLRKTGMWASIENIEYFDNLRNFSLEIDSMNIALHSNISFRIKGFELGGFSPSARLGSMSPEENGRWFVNERDTNLSVGLIKYMNENPNEEIFVFYGGAHLQKGYVQKDVYTNNLRDGRYGYFLAHYLKNYYGEDNILSINQTTTRQMFGLRFVYSDVNKEYFIRSSDTPRKDSSITKQFDGIIYRPIYKFCVPHRLGKLICKKLIELEIKNLQDAAPISENHVMRLLNDQFTDLYFGIHFSQFNEYAKWCEQNMNRLNFDSINAGNLGRSFANYLMRKWDNKEYELVYFQEFGLMEDQIAPFDTLNWQNQRWPEGFMHIKFFNSIASFWFGYPNEKQSAKQFLVEFSGQDLDSPQKYMQWYRNKYYGYDF